VELLATLDLQKEKEKGGRVTGMGHNLPGGAGKPEV